MLFDTLMLQEPIEILGSPVVTLHLAVDKPIAFVAVRLNEVMATGESRRVTYGILNLCHKTGSEVPSTLEPNRRYVVRVKLDNAAHRFHAGSRVRVAISTTYWPMILPAPEPVRLTVVTALSTLTLPIRPSRPQDELLRPFGPAIVPPLSVETVSSRPGIRVVEWDSVNEKQVIHHEVSNGVVLLKAINTRLIAENKMRSEIREHEAEASIEYTYQLGWERDQWRTRVLASSRVTTTPTTFVIEGSIRASDGEEEVFTRTWTKDVMRRFV
jgi:hypothetical protein